MSQPEELMTLAEAARELGLTRQRLAILAKEGRLAQPMAGPSRVFTRAELERYLPSPKASRGAPLKDVPILMSQVGSP